MRLFLGIELPFEVKKHIYDYLHPIKKSEKGWEKAHDYHQTLLFIGEANEVDLALIKERMDQFRYDSFELKLGQFQFFNRRIMYLGLEESSPLKDLKKSIDVAFPEWCRPGEKPFLPHITVKRWQRYEYDDLTEGLQKVPFMPVSFSVNELALFESKKDQFENKYHVIYRQSFKA